ncbi:MAG: hypothetical protein GBAus27B_000174 [Mycoplasmataceae bacterium]|nr:MAG: hypothetical protein GBAus27B_000174 [Mycoplasmataceae bacterium]
MNKQVKRGRESSFFPKKQEWIGEILAKKQQKVYNNNEFYGNTYYKLKAKDQEDKIRAIFVYPNVVSKEIFNTIEKDNYIYKKYLFFCERKKWGGILQNWQEITPNLSAYQSTINQKNHVQEK